MTSPRQAARRESPLVLLAVSDTRRKQTLTLAAEIPATRIHIPALAVCGQLTAAPSL